MLVGVISTEALAAAAPGVAAAVAAVAAAAAAAVGAAVAESKPEVVASSFVLLRPGEQLIIITGLQRPLIEWPTMKKDRHNGYLKASASVTIL